jgi:hypothetical protein
MPWSSKRGRAVILAPTAWGLRNIVLSGALDRLRAELGAVTLLASGTADSALAEVWDDGGAPSDVLHTQVTSDASSTRRRVTALLHASFGRRYRISTYEIFSRWRQRDAAAWQRFRHRLLRGLTLVTSRQPFYRWQIGYLERDCLRAPKTAAVVRQLEQLRPTLLVSTSCIVSDELPYILAARQLGIPTLGCVLSFDNLSSKSVLPTFDHYAVWGRSMREEVLRFYPDRDPARIHVTGSPQFDFHLREDCRWSRARTLQELGLRPSDRYVLHAANSENYTPTEPALVAAFAKVSAAVPELRDHRIVVRPHPADDLRRWSGVGDQDGRIVVAPPRDERAKFATSDAQARLVSTVRHADVCVNMASTMSLDAAVLGTPVVCIGFALKQGSLEDWLAGACYRTDHFRPVAVSGGVRLATSMGDLVAETARYARDRSRDQAARVRLVEDVCGLVDGRAGQRIAELIVRLATPTTDLAGAEAPREAESRMGMTGTTA